MNVLDVGAIEVFTVLLIAFIVLGPERMIDTARMIGKGIGELKRISKELEVEGESIHKLLLSTEVKEKDD